MWGNHFYIALLLLRRRIHIILDVGTDNILCALHDTCAFMEQSTLCLTMREHCYTTHNGLDGISVDDALFDTGDEEGCLATSEIVVEVDEECEEGGLARV
jgi:hypothetical protein